MATGNSGSAPRHCPLIKAYLDKPDSIQGAVAEFEKAGLGEKVKSWVSSGPNLPITAKEIQKALGSDEGTGRPSGHPRRQGRGHADEVSARRHRQGDHSREPAAAAVGVLVAPVELVGFPGRELKRAPAPEYVFARSARP